MYIFLLIFFLEFSQKFILEGDVGALYIFAELTDGTIADVTEDTNFVSLLPHILDVSFDDVFVPSGSISFTSPFIEGQLKNCFQQSFYATHIMANVTLKNLTSIRATLTNEFGESCHTMTLKQNSASDFIPHTCELTVFGIYEGKIIFKFESKHSQTLHKVQV